MINKALFKNLLQPFNDIQLKDLQRNLKSLLWSSYSMGMERKGTQQFHLQMLPFYRNKKRIC